MKVEIEASELINGDIKKLSLVEHGAIRQPFKILKTEEIASKSGGVRNTINKIFGQTEEQHIAALFVRKSVARRVIPVIKANGFRVEKEHAEMMGDVLVLKQEGYDPDVDLPIIALNTDVAVQLSSLSKFFDPYPASSSFNDNVAAGSFWPGMHNAMESLADTVWNVLNESDSPDDAASAVSKQIKAFSTHLNNLVAELPIAVFKMERELTKEFEGSTVSETSIETIVNDEESEMKTPVLKEAAAGDLDGLLKEAPAADAALAKANRAAEAAASVSTDVQFFKGDEQLTEKAFVALADDVEVIVKQEGKADKTMKKADIMKGGDEGAPASGGSPGNPVVESTSDTGLVALDEGGVPAGMRKEERMVKTIVDGKLVEKTGLYYVNDAGDEIFAGWVEKTEPAPTDSYSDADKKLFEAMGVLAKSVVDLKDMVEKQNERIEAVAKTADSAQDAADNTVVMSADNDLDNAIATLTGQKRVEKGAAPAASGEVVDLWKGVLPMLNGDAA